MNCPRILRAGLSFTLLLTLLACATVHEPLRTVEFHSPAVERTMKYNVALPAGYESSDERYSVLYLVAALLA